MLELFIIVSCRKDNMNYIRNIENTVQFIEWAYYKDALVTKLMVRLLHCAIKTWEYNYWGIDF